MFWHESSQNKFINIVISFHSTIYSDLDLLESGPGDLLEPSFPLTLLFFVGLKGFDDDCWK